MRSCRPLISQEELWQRYNKESKEVADCEGVEQARKVLQSPQGTVPAKLAGTTRGA